MPTESTFLFAGLLFLAAALGYVFARFGDLDEEEEAQRSAKSNFLRGFRYFLNEEPDRAVEVFTGNPDLSEEGLDTQMALGVLFRRRGEVERAIRLHQDLLDRSSLSGAQREEAAFALAEDYLSAGLFDRAEDLYLGLRESARHRMDALGRLLRISEVTRDWRRAIELHGELARSAPDSIRPAELAHYYVELADQARRGAEWDESQRFLDQADAVDAGKVRTMLVRGELAKDRGQLRDARGWFVGVARVAPDMLGEVVPRLVRTGESEGELSAIIQSIAGTPEGLRGVALAVIREPSIVEPAALECLARYIAGHPILSALVGHNAELVVDAPGRHSLDEVRGALHKLAQAGTRYQCGNCGYASASLQWQCPGCRSWDTVRLSDRLLFKGSPL